MQWEPPLFLGTVYYMQISGADRERVMAVRTLLENNGAEYCADPTAPRCTMVIAFAPKRRFTFSSPLTIEKEVALGPLDGIWTFQEICIRLARRPSAHRDPKRAFRKHVVDANWVEHCLKTGKLSGRDTRFDHFEIITEDKVDSRPIRSSSTSSTFVTRSEAAPAPATLMKISSSNSAGDVPENLAEPLPATNPSGETRIFDQLTNGRGFPQTFFVVPGNLALLVKHAIEREGGLIDNLEDSTFVVCQGDLDPTTDCDIIQALRARRGAARRPVSAKWIETCIEEQKVVPVAPFLLELPTSEPTIPSKDSLINATAVANRKDLASKSLVDFRSRPADSESRPADSHDPKHGQSLLNKEKTRPSSSFVGSSALPSAAQDIINSIRGITVPTERLTAAQTPCPVAHHQPTDRGRGASPHEPIRREGSEDELLKTAVKRIQTEPISAPKLVAGRTPSSVSPPTSNPPASRPHAKGKGLQAMISKLASENARPKAMVTTKKTPNGGSQSPRSCDPRKDEDAKVGQAGAQEEASRSKSPAPIPVSTSAPVTAPVTAATTASSVETGPGPIAVASKVARGRDAHTKFLAKYPSPAISPENLTTPPSPLTPLAPLTPPSDTIEESGPASVAGPAVNDSKRQRGTATPEPASEGGEADKRPAKSPRTDDVSAISTAAIETPERTLRSSDPAVASSYPKVDPLPGRTTEEEEEVPRIPTTAWEKPRVARLETALRDWVATGTEHKTRFLKTLKIEGFKVDWFRLYKKFKPFLESRIPGLRATRKRVPVKPGRKKRAVRRPRKDDSDSEPEEDWPQQLEEDNDEIMEERDGDGQNNVQSREGSVEDTRANPPVVLKVISQPRTEKAKPIPSTINVNKDAVRQTAASMDRLCSQGSFYVSRLLGTV